MVLCATSIRWCCYIWEHNYSILTLQFSLRTSYRSRPKTTFLLSTRLTFAHFRGANDRSRREEATDMPAANKALRLQACPPVTSGPFALVLMRLMCCRPTWLLLSVETRGHSSKWTPRTDRLQRNSSWRYWKRKEDEPRLENSGVIKISKHLILEKH